MIVVIVVPVVSDAARADQQQVRGASDHDHVQFAERYSPAVDDLSCHPPSDGAGH